MELRGMKRMASVGVLTGALLLGVGVVPGGAAQDTLPTYSDEDCSTLLDVQVEDSSGGYWGETALNASEAFSGAAGDIEDKQLRKSMKTLAKVWKIVGEKKNAIAAAKATGRIGNRYSNALGVYTKAIVTCSNQSLTATTEDTSSSDDSSSSESSE